MSIADEADRQRIHRESALANVSRRPGPPVTGSATYRGVTQEAIIAGEPSYPMVAQTWYTIGSDHGTPIRALNLGDAIPPPGTPVVSRHVPNGYAFIYE